MSTTQVNILLDTVLLLFIVTTYRRRFFISFWLMKQRRKYRAMDKKDVSCLYDVFISYSHEEHDWVTQQLIPELEMKNPKLKACIHERDFKVGVDVDVSGEQKIKLATGNSHVS